MKYQMKRRGRKNKVTYYLQKKYSNQWKDHYEQKYWRSLAIILALMVLTIIIFYGYAQAINAHAEVNSISASLQKESSNSAKLAALNASYRDKLDGIFSETTSTTTKAIVDYYLVKYFGQKAPEARKVFTCESGLRPEAVNTKNVNGSVDAGVPQINSVHSQRFEKMYGVPLEIGAHDIDLSIQYAKFLYDHQKWAPWTCAKKLGLN